MTERLLEALEFVSGMILSPTGNSLAELAIVTASLALLLLVSLALRQARARRSRAKIPLVVGGWGTRGKSGTERKKAALLGALGAGVVCKTTGCEPMLVVAGEMERARELHIFRPHGKPSIWEQVDVLDTAAALGADSFLWECMALRPDYAEILQEAWARDDVTTVVNAYPDHLDVQGPSGRDVANVMAEFTPRGGRVLTGERRMLPVLEAAARARGATLEATEAWEAELLCPDVLERFPYSVHPSNMALLVRFGRLVGAERDFVLKETADFIVPDLGVLKTYPSAAAEIHVLGRRLRFSNSMSANERAGTLSNWSRLELDHPDRDRSEWVVVIVNNRDDRVPRSLEFASLIVDDIAAHRFILIGTNLKGLRGFIERALDDRLARLVPPTEVEALADWSHDVLERDAITLRALPRTPAELRGRVSSVLGLEVDAVQGLGDTAELTLSALIARLEAATARAVSPSERAHVAAALQAHQRFRAHAQALTAALNLGTHQAVERWLAAHKVWYRESFLDSVSAVEDPYVPGDALIRHMASLLPTRARAHWVGIQNIKGVGLDLALRFFRLGELQRTLERLAWPGAAGRRALEALRALEDPASYEVDLIQRAVAKLLADGGLAPDLRCDLADCVEGLPVGEVLLDAPVPRTPLTLLLELVEPAVDMFLSLGRTKRARLALQDLRDERISMTSAMAILRETTGQQRGSLSKLLRRDGTRPRALAGVRRRGRRRRAGFGREGAPRRER